MLHCLLLSSNTSNEILEAVAVGLSLLEEVHHAQSTEYSRGCTVPEVCQGIRGCPTFDIKADQLEYLLQVTFNLKLI